MAPLRSIGAETLAFGRALGTNPAVFNAISIAQQRATRSTPAQLLLDAVASHQTQRCFVEFSGGVDSSLVLSAACRIARDRDVAPPIPVTLRYTAAGTDEREFQERMIEFLGLSEWQVIDVDAELDLVGPTSQHHLLAHGAPIAARIAGRDWWLDQLDVGDNACILTGEGGDEVLGSAPLAASHAVRYALRHRRHRRQAAAVVRHRMRPRRHTDPPQWLTPLGARRLSRAARREWRPTFTMQRYLRRYRAASTLVRSQYELDAQATRHDLRLSSPLLDLDFLAGLTASVPDHHFINRLMMVRQYFSDFLPPEVLHRTDKVYFGAAVFNTHTRRFAAEWDGRRGVPLDLADAEAVRAAWLDGSDARSGLMLQSAWLASQAGR